MKPGLLDPSATTPVLANDKDAHQSDGRRSLALKKSVNEIYQKWIIEFLLRQKPLPPSHDGRHVPLDLNNASNTLLVDERRGGSQPYISNSIRSSRYTLWDFLPKQIIFQATRLSNFYFIVIGVPQTIPGFSTTGNYTTILPLLFFMIITVLKEGYDDWRRHRLDEVENNNFATALRSRHENNSGKTRWTLPSWKALPLPRRKRIKAVQQDDEVEEESDADYHWSKVKWRNIKVGDVLRLKRNDAVPADVVLLSASGDDGTAYVETMALDGETNLKSKQSTSCTQDDCATITGLKNLSAEFVLEDPNRDLYNFEGRISVPGDSRHPLTLNQVILRGSIVRNTSSAIGIVINTGEECKIRMNANHHPTAKKPRLEHYANQVVMTLIVYVVLLSVGLSMGYIIWSNNVEDKSWYLNDASVPFKQIIIGFAIMFNNVIPLAMYVSLEIVKLCQALMVSSDMHMYDEERETPMRCNTNTILENLGQVGFVLSDKTGTLTENIMRFRGMSVAGTVWMHGDEEAVSSGLEEQVTPSKQEGEAKTSIEVTELAVPTDYSHGGRPSMPRRSSSRQRTAQPELSTTELVQYIQKHPNTEFSRKVREFLLGMALCHTCLPEMSADGSLDFQASSPDELALVRAARDLGFVVVQRSSQSITVTVPDASGSEKRETYSILDVVEFSSARRRMSIILKCPDDRIWLFCKGADSAIIPLLKQAALAERKSKDVRRSAEVGREELRRSLQVERRSGLGERPSMAIERIRMSMDLRRSMDIRPSFEGARIQVGRPSPSPDRLRVPSSERYANRNSKFAFLDSAARCDDATVFSKCFKHLDDFATEGLRTLMFAHKFVEPEDYAAWKKLYVDASTSLTNRQARIEAAGDLIEQSLGLLGASAIEDKLQEGVPETIDKLRRANMRIWMLTGDKRETAINIAHSARICRPESIIFVLDAAKASLEGQLRAALDELLTNPIHTVAVIDGHTLSVVDADSALEALFYTLIPRLDSVICCRASPAQKASITLSIPANVPGKPLTLAIGDGSNDIAMLQAAHVGVGISGREGLQAARVADYSISQFRFLQRLLLVHGRWNYIRTAKFILWTFWKEMFFYIPQAVYQRYTGYTGASAYENWSLTALNTLFTSLCVIMPGILEKDLEAETLLAVPELYAYGQGNRELNLPRYLRWMVGATAEGCLIWFMAWSFGRFNTMGDNGLFAIGDLSFSLAIVWTNVKLLLIETHSKTAMVIGSFIITFAGWWAWNGFLSAAYSDNLSPYDVNGGFTSTFGNDPNWWLTLIVAIGILTVVEICFKTTKRLLVREGILPIEWRRKGSNEARKVERELGFWQEMEREPDFKERLREMEGGTSVWDVVDRSPSMQAGQSDLGEETLEKGFGPVRGVDNDKMVPSFEISRV